MRDPKYGVAHDRARTWWKRRLEELGSLPCALCPHPVYPWQPWHLDHVPGTVGEYRGVAHRRCNTSDGAKRGNAARAAKPKRVVL